VAGLDGVDVTLEQVMDQGFALLEQCVDRALASSLRADVLDLCRRRNWMPPAFPGFAYGSAEFLDLQREVNQLPQFDAIRASPRLRLVIEEVLGGGYLDRQGDVCRVMFPQAPGFVTRAHQDAFFLRNPDDVWAAWIPLGDCPRTMGPLVVWPESHKLGLLPHLGESGCEGACSGADWTGFDLACGDALLVNKLTVHRALPNVSEAVRVSVDFRFGAPSR
jgi:hypothetical protein